MYYTIGRTRTSPAGVARTRTQAAIRRTANRPSAASVGRPPTTTVSLR